MTRIKAAACGLAWRVLWAWWPDRVYRSAALGGHEYAKLEQAPPWAAPVYEKLDHQGKRVR